MAILNVNSLTPEELRADVNKYIENLPDDLSYKDLFESSNSTLMIDLMIGFSTWLNQHYIAQRTETYLDYAVLKNSVVELAYNRGYLTPPNSSAEVSFMLTNSSENPNSVIIKESESLGLAGNENVLSLENVAIAPGESKEVSVTFGTIKEFQTIVSDIQPFSKMTFLVPEGNIASQFETLTINDEEIPISDDLAQYNNLKTQGFGDFVLRRSLDQESRIYFGNGKIGWWKASDSGKYVINYKTMYFNDFVDEAIPQINIIDPYLTKSNEKIIRKASYEDIEKIRNLASYYPLDGRITQDRDYETLILKYFQTEILDVMSYNIHPDQNVYMLIDGVTDGLLDEITNLIDSRRAMGIYVHYYWNDISDGETFILKANVKDIYKINDINDIIAKMKTYLLTTYTKKYFRGSDAFIDPDEISSELSALFNLTLTATDDNVKLDVSDGKYLKDFQLVVEDVY